MLLAPPLTPTQRLSHRIRAVDAVCNAGHDCAHTGLGRAILQHEQGQKAIAAASFKAKVSTESASASMPSAMDPASPWASPASQRQGSPGQGSPGQGSPGPGSPAVVRQQQLLPEEQQQPSGSMRRPAGSDGLSALMHAWDRNKDGLINRSELRQAVRVSLKLKATDAEVRICY